MATIFNIKDFRWCCGGEEKCPHGDVNDVKRGVYDLMKPLLEEYTPQPLITMKEEAERGDVVRCNDGFMIFNGFIWLEVKNLNDCYIIPASFQDFELYYFDDIFPGNFVISAE